MNDKFTEIEEKNMEFITKLCKIELDTAQNFKEFRESMNDFNKTKNYNLKKWKIIYY